MIPKFRCFDKDTKTMHEVVSIDFRDWRVYYEAYGLRSYWNKNIVLMQSTGIKDKNGVEIYEGDILKLHAIFLAPDDKIGYLEYSPKYGYSIIFERNRLYRQEYWASTNKLNYEVIGNIYENPELLKGHEK